ncbi:beta-lactamase regulating signal transducer with metallopeptidase domain [Filimonas zeae]|uniref:Peptidase M56 domain-containing protein n=1 Tax=Filimonas zeae TaxID=1737353 RepID=A0A917IRU5_9BACT|nr:M56 family metallopeptidase [Filimonas zeae]MDR6338058.1 beta-lactamase regulating signal transducer with metallopeptidase domain [Filimonas zeae]GGH61504.1 hypothetical protein GCM10011379_10560 [Filimonas zeae]
MHLYLNISVKGEQLMQAFSWMLIHSLWQGLLLAIVTAVCMHMSKSAAARVRYVMVFILFSFFILACGFTFLYQLNGASHSLMPLGGTIGHNASHWLPVNAAHLQFYTTACAGFISAHASWLVLLWTAFFAWRLYGMVQGMRWLHKARHRYTSVPEGWQQRLNQLGAKLRISNPVRLLESAFVKAPMVIGHLKPVILMPAGLLTGLPAGQLEAVLLHELAHIRRYDYLVNLLQTVCETMFFFNLGMLWVSALLREEREHCCDDIALEQTGNKKEFIQALISFKEHTMYAHHTAVAFPGKKNQLLHRVSRIVHNKNQSLATGEKVFCMAGFLLLSAVLVTAAVTQLRSSDNMPGIEKRVFVGYYYTPAAQQSSAAFTLASVTGKEKQEAAKLLTQKLQLVKTTVRRTMPVARSLALPQPKPGASTEKVNQVHTVVNTVYTKEATPLQEQEIVYHIQAEKDRQRALLDHMQAEKDRQQANRDREQADRDRLQAEKDREQARLDRIQADKDRLQADRDRAQAERDRQQAAIEREAALKLRNALSGRQ